MSAQAQNGYSVPAQGGYMKTVFVTLSMMLKAESFYVLIVQFDIIFIEFLSFKNLYV